MTTLKEHDEKTLVEATGCSHHWVIDSPNGPTSRGVCKRCGAIKEFHNSVPGFVGSWIRSTQGSQRKVNDKSYKPGQNVEPEPDEETPDTNVYTDTTLAD